MTEGKVLLTQEGYDNLNEELNYLITEKRGEVSEKIKIARGFGDLSENAEYDEAKAEQVKVESRISEIELQLKKAEIIERPKSLDSNIISIGDKVVITDLSKNNDMELQIVGTVEADISKHRLSNESLLGKALINSKAGDIVTVKTKVNTIKYKIKEIIR